MIRTLFVLAAVVAAVLAIILNETPLYIAAVVLLLVALAVLVFVQQKRIRQNAAYASGSGDDELTSLGILSVRPRPKSGAAAPGEAGRLPSPPERAPQAEPLSARSASPKVSPAAPRPRQDVATANGNGAHPSSSVRVMRGTSRAKDEPAVTASNTEALHKGVLLPCLRSLLAAVRGHTVCLLRQESAGGRYRIEAVVSRDTQARLRGHFSARSPFLATLPEEVVVSSVGAGGVPEDYLGYYHEPVDVRQVAWTPLPGRAEPHYVLLADTKQETGFGIQEPALLADYADLLTALLAVSEEKPAQDATPEQDEEPAAELAEDEAEDASLEPVATPQEPARAASKPAEVMDGEEQATDEETSAAPPTRPRREIIAEEIERAHAEAHPLALALVYLNWAEEVAEAGEETVVASEAALEDHLRRETPDGRVERFGELTYGVFLERDGAEAEAWATRLQDQLAQAAGPLEGGVSIGIAVLGERHRSPDALRDDAMQALQEAYQTGTSTILE